ncbi:hypothetical protein MMC13_001674 [Lambiella insularis]|nr:hypothetical protein [Lambiella insularis]
MIRCYIKCFEFSHEGIDRQHAWIPSAETQRVTKGTENPETKTVALQKQQEQIAQGAAKRIDQLNEEEMRTNQHARRGKVKGEDGPEQTLLLPRKVPTSSAKSTEPIEPDNLYDHRMVWSEGDIIIDSSAKEAMQVRSNGSKETSGYGHMVDGLSATKPVGQCGRLNRAREEARTKRQEATVLVELAHMELQGHPDMEREF